MDLALDAMGKKARRDAALHEAVQAFRDAAVDEAVETMQGIIQAVRAMRNKHSLPTKRPVKRITLIPFTGEGDVKLYRLWRATGLITTLANEANVWSDEDDKVNDDVRDGIEYAGYDVEGTRVERFAIPNYQSEIGRKKQKEIRALSHKDIWAALLRERRLWNEGFDKDKFPEDAICEDDIVVRARVTPGKNEVAHAWNEAGIAIFINTELTPDMERAWMDRELQSKSLRGSHASGSRSSRSSIFS